MSRVSIGAETVESGGEPGVAGTLLAAKVRGCLYGGAIGDALGAPAEGRSPAEIRARYDEILDFVEPWDGPSDLGKGYGRYTDDSHMVQVLARIYLETGDHLDPYGFARAVVPLIADEPRWIPEWGREAPLVERLFWPEKWLLMRLRLANADPRLGGVGNMVNCGAAMYASPVGIVNAGNPIAAYREAIEVFAAHQTSYGLEAAGVMAACVAAALDPHAGVASVIKTALELAKEGTRTAIEAVVDRAQGLHDWRAANEPLREAIRPFDGAAEEFADRGNGRDDWTPSRQRAIEELPVALGFLIVAAGDLPEAVRGAANYGRDNDSIAGMVGAIAGALGGEAVIPPAWIGRVETANRVDLGSLGDRLAELAVRLQRRDFAAARRREEAFARLLESTQQANIG